MDYFQFQAHKMLLLKKEDREWQDFCKQVAPDCAACLAEQTDSAKSKDIGIQASSKRPINEIRKVTFESKQTDKQISENLNNIASRLEKIVLALPQIYDVPSENESMKSKAITLSDNEKSLRSFEEQRKLFIQNSLKTSLKKLQSTSSTGLKKSPTAIKIKNSGYCIPHELQVKRASARKAYLKSLQTKPKILGPNSKKNVPNCQNKNFPNKILKSKKNIKTKVKQESDVCEAEVQTAFSETNTIKDENIERVVAAIFDDLLGDAALDLNRIEERKKGEKTLNRDGSIKKNQETSTSLNSLAVMQTEPKVIANDKKDLKLLLEPSKILQQENQDLKKEILDINKNTIPTENQSSVKKISSDEVETSSEMRIHPKFVCEGPHVLTIDMQSVKNISQNKDNFFSYLQKISRRVKGNFNPWDLNEKLADSILNDCIEDIAKELCEMPNIAVQDIYNKEFVQVVE